jgi:hypothetical protein
VKKCVNQITFYFVEEGPGRGSAGRGSAGRGSAGRGSAGRGSEDVKRECNVNCSGFSFFSVFLMDVMGGKITVNLKELH